LEVERLDEARQAVGDLPLFESELQRCTHRPHQSFAECREKAGPTSAEGSTALWLYHSHVDEGRDINSGLIGPLIVTRRGMARPDASPTDVDREFVAQFGFYDEHLSWGSASSHTG
jgi:hypothetical protein